MASTIEIIPLGGLGEFGMNCSAIRYGDDMILIDAGLAFPSGHLAGLGIDLIVPDLEFLRSSRDQLRCILLTHGHEDHAGAVSYVVDELPVPVYGSPLTLGLVEQRLRERGMLDSTHLEVIEPRQVLDFGEIRVEPLHVTHSFPDSFCFSISTPVGRLIWTGDFKFDQTPLDQLLSDVPRLAEYGEEGVLALFSDSTNSSTHGLSPTEHSVIEPLRQIFRSAKKKVLVSCFASSIHRIQIVLDLAAEFGRKVVPAGRSMVTALRVAGDLGYITSPPDLLVSASEAANYPPEKVTILATGSQGEPMAALSRLAVNEFKHLTVEEGDVVILSARIIPGNERLISNLTNHFCRRGARVFDSRHAQVHASGHGFQADLRLMINLTQPKFFVPIHGEYRQLCGHGQLAEEQGIPKECIHIIENGEVLSLTAEEAVVTGKVPVGRRLLDEGRREQLDELVVRERRFLSEDGFLVLVLTVDRSGGALAGEPDIMSRGFMPAEISEALMDSLSRLIAEIVEETPLEEKLDEEVFNEILVTKVRRFIRKKTGKRPIVLPVILEV